MGKSSLDNGWMMLYNDKVDRFTEGADNFAKEVRE
jgi:hypothetical protein